MVSELSVLNMSGPMVVLSVAARAYRYDFKPCV
jgi:hypothetical protein